MNILASSERTKTNSTADFNSFLQKKELSNQAIKITPPLFLKSKMTIGTTDDVHEQEADAIADSVICKPMHEPINFLSPKNSVNRKCTECKEEEKLQRKESSGDLNSVAPPIVHDVINTSYGKSLDPDTRSYMEPRFGYDFSNVKIHDNELAAKSADSINALAYTSGNNVVFNSGQYNTNSDSGKRLLAHELTHIVQQTYDASAPSIASSSHVLDDMQNRVKGKTRRDADKVVLGSYAPIKAFHAHEFVIFREPLKSNLKQAPIGDPERLKNLFDVVKATPIGKKFLRFTDSEPNIVWGNSDDLHGKFDGKTITLNETEENLLNDCEWQQVIAMELGNAANIWRFDPVFRKAEQGKLSKDDFVRKIEEIEFKTRNLVIDAYENGEFGAPSPNCPSIFTRVSFDDYMKSPKLAPHIAYYQDQWEQYYMEIYLKKHPTK